MKKSVTLELSEREARNVLRLLFGEDYEPNRGHFMKSIYRVCDELGGVLGLDREELGKRKRAAKRRRREKLR